MHSAALVRPLPVQDWYTTDRRHQSLRNCIILALALALHLLAAFAISGVRNEHRAGPATAPVITTIRLIGAQQAVQETAAQPVAAKAKAPMPPRRNPTAAPATHVAVNEQRAAALPAEVPVIVAPTVRETEYRLARRSVAFGGSEPRDDVAPAATPARGLDSWISEGIARSVWAVANELVAGGDGQCELTGSNAQLVCETSELTGALARVPEPAQRSLATWVHGGFVRLIEIRIEHGSANYAVRF